jgi:signal transduction histidine kinase/CheY-like chemotaxis protein/HAMP domain-containing protein
LTPAIIISVVTIGVAVGAGIIAARFLTRPVEQLRAGAEIIGAGNLDHRIRVRSQDEIGSLAQALNQMATRLKASRTEIEQWGSELENRVQERTRELSEASERMQRRALQLQTSAEVARAIASVRDLDQLLPQITQLISERFGWYHVGIFLTDATGSYAVLQAANSEGGQQMLARGHRLRVGETGIVGYVTSTGHPRIAENVGEDAVYFDTPELHGTRSEMALPLKVGDDIIGALDVQSTEPSAYDDEDVTLLGILAAQVAIAIENARHFEQTQQALKEVQAVHRQYVQKEWSQAVAGRSDLAFEYRRSGIPSLDDPLPPELDIALKEGRVVSVPGHPTTPTGDDGGEGRDRAALAVPIKLRDQVIGALDLQDVTENRQWHEDEIALVQAISDQVALALENARLFADTQRRAEQLATLHRVGLDVTSALDLDGVLNALYEQIQRILETDSFHVALYDQTTGIIEFPLLTGIDGPIQIEPLNIRNQPGVTGHVIESGQPLYLPDLHEAPGETPYHAIALSDRKTRSYLGVPLIFREQVFGVLSIQSYKPNVYSESDVELLVTLATQASIAIQNARAYERLVETAEELRELDRLKTQFLANMSHELRTPLNSIIGFSRVMLKGIDGPLNELQEADLTSIYNSGQHLLSLINSILDMSKIEAGKMDLSFDELHLSDIFDPVMSTTSALVKDKPIELRFEVPEEPPTVWGDVQRIRQVLINLMSNAVKFTEKGHITLAAEVGPRFVTISVSDTGIGIEPEAQNRLFIPFQQVDASTTRRASGTGLGLAISRSFVEMHGGEIWVESKPGKGSAFYFTLPIYQTVQGRTESDAEVSLDPEKKLVLVIDDDQGVQTLMKRYLESDGYQTIGTRESAQALETARRLAPHLTAITLDVVMPHMDGWKVLRALKQDPQTQHIPVVLCSVVEGLEQGLGMGAAACLQKPVTRDEVLEVLRRVESRAAHAITT